MYGGQLGEAKTIFLLSAKHGKTNITDKARVINRRTTIPFSLRHKPSIEQGGKGMTIDWGNSMSTRNDCHEVSH